MNFTTVTCFALVAAACLAALVEGRPATEEGVRRKRSSVQCQPKMDESLEQRTLCPFTTNMTRVFLGMDLEVEVAELDPECVDSDLSCGEGGRGECTAVRTDITYRNQTASLTLAFVCSYPEDGVSADRVPNLASR